MNMIELIQSTLLKVHIIQLETEYIRINRVLDIFREGNKLYGYNKKIKIINMEEK